MVLLCEILQIALDSDSAAEVEFQFSCARFMHVKEISIALGACVSIKVIVLTLYRLSCGVF